MLNEPAARRFLEAYSAVTDASYSAKAGDRVIGVNRAGVVTITLPTAELKAGRFFLIKDESGAAGSNTITVATEGSETIDGSATDTIVTNFGAKSYYSDGTNWFQVPLLPAAAVAHSATTGRTTGDHHSLLHQAGHNSGGADALKLDNLDTPEDNTDLDFSTTLHGLVPKGPNDGTFLKADGTWTAPGGGGAVERAGGSTTEATTASLSLADLLTVGSLTIPAVRFIEVIYMVRKTSGAADDCNDAFTINTTNLAAEKVFSTTNQAESSLNQWDFGPRVTNYTGVARHTRLQSSPSGAYSILAHASTNLPTVEITALNSRGSVDDVNITLGHDELHIYTRATS